MERTSDSIAKTTNTPSTLLMGAGYVGTALALELGERGGRCEVAVASKRSAERLNQMGQSPLRIDLDGSTELTVPSVNCIVYMVPPRRTCDSDERLRAFLNSVPDGLERLIYVSTSGVYGDQQGRLIDESTQTSPHSARAHRRLDAESQVKSWCEDKNINWIIARVPGIYGPGRLPLGAIKEGRSIIRVQESNPGNRIHRDDLARALADLTKYARPEPALPGSLPNGERLNPKLGTRVGEIFNVSDNNHLSGSEFTLAVAKMAGLPEPPQISRSDMKAQASTKRWSFLAESRRLDSRKLLNALLKPLRFSDPVEGIRASLAAPDDPAA